MDGDGGAEDAEMEKCAEKMVYMWGYIPGALPERSPILSPMPVPLSDPALAGDSWKDVCNGGCGFAMAISENGKLITWGATDDESQSYLTSGKHGEIPEAFPLPTEASVVKAAAGWAHCVLIAASTWYQIRSEPDFSPLFSCFRSFTDMSSGTFPDRSASNSGIYTVDPSHPLFLHSSDNPGVLLVSKPFECEVYAWGWKECVPSGKFISDFFCGGSLQKEVSGKQSSLATEPGSPQGSNTSSGSDSHPDNKKVGEEIVKRWKISSAKQESDSPASGDEFFTVSPSLVTLSHGVKMTSVATGGRHTLALSDVGQVWGWGYGDEGQLGLGSRVKMVASRHLIPCAESSTSGKDKSSIIDHGSTGAGAQVPKVSGSYVKEIACGGRHSAVITDTGTQLTFGWGLYGQTLPRLLGSPCLENKRCSAISCGARHSAALTDNGQLFTWGWNKYGQLGLGDSVDRNTPSQVSIGDCLPRNVACGWWHTLMLADKPA